jgi:hypothetical protein
MNFPLNPYLQPHVPMFGQGNPFVLGAPGMGQLGKPRKKNAMGQLPMPLGAPGMGQPQLPMQRPMMPRNALMGYGMRPGSRPY